MSSPENTVQTVHLLVGEHGWIIGGHFLLGRGPALLQSSSGLPGVEWSCRVFGPHHHRSPLCSLHWGWEGEGGTVIRTCRCLSDRTDHLVFQTELTAAAALFVVGLVCLLLLALLKMYSLREFLKSTLRNSHTRMTSYYQTLLGVLTRIPKCLTINKEILAVIWLNKDHSLVVLTGLALLHDGSSCSCVLSLLPVPSLKDVGLKT